MAAAARAAEAEAARTAEVARLARSVAGFKSHFTRAIKRLDTIVASTTVPSQRTERLYREILKASENLDMKSANLEQVMERQKEVANYQVGSEDEAAWETAYDELVDKYTNAHTAAVNSLSRFSQDIVDQVEGRRQPVAQPAGAAAAEPASPKVQSNADLKPPVLQHDADVLFVDAWWDKFEAWYTASNFAQANIKVQRSFLASVLDPVLIACLNSLAPTDRVIYGTQAVPGCIEIIQEKFASEQPVFLSRLKYQDLKQDRHETLSDYINRVLQFGRIARLSEMDPDDHYVQKIISSAKPETRHKLLKLANPTVESIRAEAATIRAAETCEAGIAGPSGAPVVNALQDWDVPPVTTKAEMREKGITCYRCGLKTHTSDKCDIFGKSCRNCGRDGHIYRVCLGRRLPIPESQPRHPRNPNRQRGQRNNRSRSNSKGRTPKQSPDRRNINEVEDVVHEDRQLNMIKSYAEAASCNINASSSGSLQNMRIQLASSATAAGISNAANPDTGSNFNVIGTCLAKKVGAAIGPMSGIRLTVANKQLLREDGTATIFVRHYGSSYALDFIVSPDLDSCVIIGRPSLITMGVIHSNFPLPVQSSPQVAAIISEKQRSHISATQQAPENFSTLEFDSKSGLQKVDQTQPDTKAHISSNSSPAIDPAFQTLLSKIQALYADVLNDKLSEIPMAGPEMEIQLEENGIRPTKVTVARAIPLHYQQRADAMLDELLLDKIIVPVSDVEEVRYCAPAFFVPKAGTEKIRLVTDYSGLNRSVVRPVHSFPSPLECINAIDPTSYVFLSADCTSGYFQIPLSKEASMLTCFLVPRGKFRYTRSPMGLSSSSDVFNQRTDEALHGLTGVIKLVDDLLVTAPDVDTLFERTCALLDRCRAHHITISHRKIKIGFSVKFAGYNISRDGIRPDPSRIAAIQLLQAPADITQLRSFLGAANQVGIFHPDLTHLTDLHRQLLKKDVAFVWSTEHQTAFEAVKAAIATEVALAYFDKALRTEVWCDASRLHGLGFALIQRNRDDKPRLIICGSRSLAKAERNYAVIELEYIAVLFGVRKCKHFLLGCPKFTVVTDHKPLQGIQSKPLQEIENNRLLNIRLKLTDFKFEIVWMQGKNHYLADLLSRNPAFSPTETEASEFSVNAVTTISEDPRLASFKRSAHADKDYQLVHEALVNNADPHALSVSHPAKKFISQWHELSTDDGLVIMNNRLVVPDSLVPDILKLLHRSHQGIRKSLQEARSLYFWPNMTVDVTNTVRECDMCQQLQPSQPQQPLQQSTASRPMEKVSVDLFQPDGCSTHFIVCVDRYSTYPLLAQLRTQTTASVIDHLDAWFLNLGYPNYLRSDGGPQFVSAQFQSYCQDNEIVHELSSAYHSQSNGQAEAAVKRCEYLLLKHQGKFSSAFKEGLLAFRNVPHTASFSPAMFFTGRRQCTKLPLLPVQYEPVDLAAAEKERLQQTSVVAASHQSSRSLMPLSLGMTCYLQNPKSHRWDTKCTVIESRDGGKSFVVESLAEKKQYLRNRIFLRPTAASLRLRKERQVRFSSKVVRHIYPSESSSDSNN